MRYRFNFVVTIESDDEHEFDDMLAELENACICIGNSYQGEITLSEGTAIHKVCSRCGTNPVDDRGIVHCWHKECPL